MAFETFQISYGYGAGFLLGVITFRKSWGKNPIINFTENTQSYL